MIAKVLATSLYAKIKHHLPNSSRHLPLALVSVNAAAAHGIAHLPVTMWQATGGKRWQVGAVTMGDQTVPSVPHVGLKITETNVDTLPVGSHIWQWCVYDGRHYTTVIAKQSDDCWMSMTDDDETQFVVDFDTAVLLSWGWPK